MRFCERDGEMQQQTNARSWEESYPDEKRNRELQKSPTKEEIRRKKNFEKLYCMNRITQFFSRRTESPVACCKNRVLIYEKIHIIIYSMGLQSPLIKDKKQLEGREKILRMEKKENPGNKMTKKRNQQKIKISHF